MTSRSQLLEMIEIQRERLRRACSADFLGTMAASMFAEQRAFFLDTSDVKAADCSRRAGKSWVIADELIYSAVTPPVGAVSYLALTRSSAKDIFWEPLKERLKFWGIPSDPREGDLSVRFPNGARIRLYGADQDKVTRRLRGNKHKRVRVDEAAFFGSALPTLVEDVLEPSLADLNGDLGFASSPGPIPTGYYYELINDPRGCSTHRWTAKENPHIPHWEQFCSRILERRGWTPETPKFRREYLGEWVHDYESLFYSFHRGRNTHVGALSSDCEWNYVMGLDFGWHDATAIVMIAFSYQHPHAFIVKAVRMTHKTISEIAPVVQEYVERYSPVKIVADTGGLGKSLTEELRKRYGLPVHTAEKRDKLAAVEFMNADWKAERLWLLEGNEHMAEQYECLLKDPDTHAEVPGIPNDMCDAALYAYRECAHYHGRIIEPIIPGSAEDWERKEKKFEREAIGDETDGVGDWV